MAGYSLSVTDIEQAYTEAEDKARNYRDSRVLRDQRLFRKLPTQVQDELTRWQEGIDYQTAAVEELMFDIVDIIGSAEPEVQVINREGKSGPAIDKFMREAEMWFATELHKLCPLEWHYSSGEGQVRHGGRWWRICNHEVKEPEYETVAGDAKKTLSNRSEVMRKRSNPWYMDDIDYRGMTWLERNNVLTHAFYKVEMPILTAYREYQGDKNEKLYLKDGKLCFDADGEAPDYNQWAGESVQVLIADCPTEEDCPLGCEDHKQRVITTIVYQAGKLGEGQIVSEQASPYPGCSFIMVPGRVSNERDYDLKYRSLLETAYVEAGFLNYVTTIMAILARGELKDDGLYIAASELDENQIRAITDAGFQVQRMDVTGENIPMYPGQLLRVPRGASPYFAELKKDAERRLEQSIGRFKVLLGLNYEEARDGTGQANMNMLQQQRHPINRMAVLKSLVMMKIADYIRHCVMWWDSGSEPSAYYEFAATTSGDELIQTGKAESGQTVVMTKADMERGFFVRVVTDTETLAEQNARLFGDLQLYDRELLTDEMLMERNGFKDIEGLKRKWREADLKKMMNPIVLNMQRVVAKYLIAVEAGVDTTELEVMVKEALATALAAPGGPESQPVGGEGPASPLHPDPNDNTPVMHPTNMTGLKNNRVPMTSGPMVQRQF